MDDLAGGHVPEKQSTELEDTLNHERWLKGWAKGLAIMAFGLVILFYWALFYFVFGIYPTTEVAIANVIATTGPQLQTSIWQGHVAIAIPIIVAFSSIPTLLLITLLRYFHHRPVRGPSQGDDDTALPNAIALIKEAATIIGQR